MRYFVLAVCVFLLAGCQVVLNETTERVIPCGSEKCYTPPVDPPVLSAPTLLPNEVYACYSQELCTPAPTSTLDMVTATVQPNEHPDKYTPEATIIPPTYATDDPDWADYATHQAAQTP